MMTPNSSPEVMVASAEQLQPLAGYPYLLTVQHLSEITGQSDQTMRTLINSGGLPGCRIGRRLYVSKARFIDFIESGRV